MKRKRLFASLAGVLLTASLIGVNAPAAVAVTSASVSIKPPPKPSALDKPAVAPPGQGLKGSPSVTNGVHTDTLGATNYTYAGATQTPATAPTGVTALMKVDNPWLSVSYEYHTLAEEAITSVNGQQAAEIGWTRDPTTFGDDHVRLFAYSWKNGVPLGYNTGFVNYASRVNTVGDDISSFVDTAPQIGWQFDVNDNLWASFNNNFLGYYPASTWSGVTPAFTTASQVKFYGEIVGRASPCTDMGSNPAVLATSTSTGAAKFSSITYDNTATVSMTPFATNSAWYSAVLMTGTVRSFYYGGPGPC